MQCHQSSSCVACGKLRGWSLSSSFVWLQFYQSLQPEKITDKFLWGRLEPLLGYLTDEQKSKVLEALHLAYDSHYGQVGAQACNTAHIFGIALNKHLLQLFTCCPEFGRELVQLFASSPSQCTCCYRTQAPSATGQFCIVVMSCGVQARKSGEPFITHPVEVTRILAELKMDHESLVAGLLHDTVEDTENVKFEEIEVWGLSAQSLDAVPVRCAMSR